MINQFITRVKSGIARTNRYKVVIPFPDGVGGAPEMRNAMLMCEAVQLPGMNIATTPARHFGEAREMPYERNFGTIQLSFIVDSTMDIRKRFENWMHKIVNPQTRTIGYYKDYVRAINITVDNVDTSTPFVMTLHEAYPKAIGDIQLDYSSKEVMKLAVTFQYKYWTTEYFAINNSAAGSRPSGASIPRNAAGDAITPGNFSTATDFRFGEQDLPNPQNTEQRFDQIRLNPGLPPTDVVDEATIIEVENAKGL